MKFTLGKIKTKWIRVQCILWHNSKNCWKMDWLDISVLNSIILVGLHLVWSHLVNLNIVPMNGAEFTFKEQGFLLFLSVSPGFPVYGDGVNTRIIRGMIWRGKRVIYNQAHKWRRPIYNEFILFNHLCLELHYTQFNNTLSQGWIDGWPDVRVKKMYSSINSVLD